jgi:hypothetical protein
MAPVKITESGKFALEVEFDLADGAVALFGDEDFGDISNVVKTLFPPVPLFNEVVVFFIRALYRFCPIQIIFFPVDKAHDICILFN